MASRHSLVTPESDPRPFPKVVTGHTQPTPEVYSSGAAGVNEKIGAALCECWLNSVTPTRRTPAMRYNRSRAR